MFQYNQPVGSRKDEPQWTLENIQLEVFCIYLQKQDLNCQKIQCILFQLLFWKKNL